MVCFHANMMQCQILTPNTITRQFSRVLINYFGYDGQEQDQTPTLLIFIQKSTDNACYNVILFRNSG